MFKMVYRYPRAKQNQEKGKLKLQFKKKDSWLNW